MKFLQSRFGNSKFGASLFGDSRTDSRPADSRLPRESRPAELSPAMAVLSQDDAQKLELRKELLRVVLAKTIQRTNVPPAWIGGELNRAVLPSGEEWIEIRLSVQADEPRFLTYLSAFQADLERRLLAAAPDVREWLSGVVWKITPDPIYELPMPQKEYWSHVQEDRLLIARQKGAMEWDRESLERHFSDTNPGELVVDYDDTKPPERGNEDIIEPPKG